MYQFESRIRFSEVDEHGKLSVEGLVDYFQDCSIFQSEDLGVGIKYLQERSLAWILASWQIEILRMPELGERVRAATWPTKFRVFFGHRNLVLYDRDDQICARANSIWVLYNMKEQRPERVPGDLISRYALEQELDMENVSRKIRLPDDEMIVLRAEPFVVGRQNLDTNHHVNNGQYVSMAMVYLPDHFDVKRLRVEYTAQAKLGDMIYPVVYETQAGCFVALNAENGKPYAVAEVTGEKSC